MGCEVAWADDTRPKAEQEDRRSGGISRKQDVLNSYTLVRKSLQVFASGNVRPRAQGVGPKGVTQLPEPPAGNDQRLEGERLCGARGDNDPNPAHVG
jgi:hypothetical protein